MKCKFRPSTHAKNRMLEWGLSKSNILEAITKGTKRVYGKKIVARTRYFEVVYKNPPCNLYIITAYVWGV